MRLETSWLPAVLVTSMVAGWATTGPCMGEQCTSKKAISAGVGAVVGATSTGDADEHRKRALIGAGVGALAGTAVGAYLDCQEERLRNSYKARARA